MPITDQFVRNLRRFRLVTFDVTDTLLRLNDPMRHYVDTAAACGVTGLNKSKVESCFRQQFKWMSVNHSNFGRDTPGMGWQKWWMQLVTKTFRSVDANIPQNKLETIAEELLKLFRTSACWTHIEGVDELLQNVRQSGKCIGIISNFDPSLVQVLSATGYNDKFDFILTSYEAGVMKPEPAIFQIPLERLKLTPTEALHIGNKFDMDFVGARSAGWSSLLVQTQTDTDNKLDTSSAAKYTFNSMAEMLQILKSQKIEW